MAADSVVPPVVDGHRDDACGYCALDVDRANELLDAAGFDRTQPIELWFNAGAGNDAWVEAIGNQLRTNLGVEFALRGDLAPPEYGPLMGTKGMTGPFRMGWSMDYPSPQNFLEPLYATDAGANFAFYSSEDFDRLVAQGNAAATSDEAIASTTRRRTSCSRTCRSSRCSSRSISRSTPPTSPTSWSTPSAGWTPRR